jgi:hypothetical protein
MRVGLSCKEAKTTQSVWPEISREISQELIRSAEQGCIEAKLITFKLKTYSALSCSMPNSLINVKVSLYKTFYGHNLRMSVISKSDSPWQAFPA